LWPGVSSARQIHYSIDGIFTGGYIYDVGHRIHRSLWRMVGGFDTSGAGIGEGIG
jgi:hypothetical protein